MDRARSFELRLPRAGRSESAGPARRAVQRADELDLRALHARDDQLPDAREGLDHERRLPVVHEQDAHGAAVVAVDRAGGVDHADAVLEREARARAYLGFVARRDLE